MREMIECGKRPSKKISIHEVDFPLAQPDLGCPTLESLRSLTLGGFGSKVEVIPSAHVVRCVNQQPTRNPTPLRDMLVATSETSPERCAMNKQCLVIHNH